MTTTTAPSPTALDANHERLRPIIRKRLAKQSFATLATTSPAGRPHVAGSNQDRVVGGLLAWFGKREDVVVRIEAVGDCLAPVPRR